jgi:5-methylcytosine-specific restriction endonuclease McrA
MTLAAKTIRQIEASLARAVGENEPGVAVGIAQGGKMVWGGGRGLANRQIEASLARAVGENEPGIAVGIAQGGKMVWGGGRGLANLKSQQVFGTQTPFRICSRARSRCLPFLARFRKRRSLVLDRNEFTCQVCGAVAGEAHPYDEGRKTRLHIGHVIDKSMGGTDDFANLRAICSVCNEGAKNLTTDRPSARKLLIQIRRATGARSDCIALVRTLPLGDWTAPCLPSQLIKTPPPSVRIWQTRLAMLSSVGQKIARPFTY